MCGDLNNVFATGFSNGGMMSNRHVTNHYPTGILLNLLDKSPDGWCRSTPLYHSVTGWVHSATAITVSVSRSRVGSKLPLRYSC